MIMNEKKLLDGVTKLYAQARATPPALLKINGDTYTIVFDSNEGFFRVYKNMIQFINFNTRQMSVAKKWLREHLAN